MDENENTSQETLTDGEGVTPAESVRTVSDGISLQEMNEIYGTTFKSKEDALKSVRETKNFVGTKKEDFIKSAKEQMREVLKEQGIDTSNFVSKADAEREKFYAKNEHLTPYQEMIDAVAKEKGISLDEVIKSDSFKPILEITEGQKSTKSILHSTNANVPVDDNAMEKFKKSGSIDDLAALVKMTM